MSSPTSDRPEAYAETIRRHLGPAVLAAFADDDVDELYLNPGDRLLRLDTRSRGRIATENILTVNETLAFLNTVASLVGVTLNAVTPWLQAELPQGLFRGARLQAFIPPLSGAPCFVLRKPPAVIYSLDDWCRAGILSPEHRALLGRHVRERSNILVAGGTRSGKTTFANALLQEVASLCPTDRVVLLEDTRELQCPAQDQLALRTDAGHGLADLVKLTLRASPDRIVVGEVRDASALDLLDAWSTGHPGGVATVHATDAHGALERLDRLAQRNRVPSQRHLVADAVQIVLVLAGVGERRHVRELVAVGGLDEAGEYQLAPL